MVYNSVSVPSSPNTAFDDFIYNRTLYTWSNFDPHTSKGGEDIDNNVVFIDESTWGPVFCSFL